jgi:hypothetical protein
MAGIWDGISIALRGLITVIPSTRECDITLILGGLAITATTPATIIRTTHTILTPHITERMDTKPITGPIAIKAWTSIFDSEGAAITAGTGN